jgi:anti-sigma regulatory factor (Ser/Thr protein kinase)
LVGEYGGPVAGSRGRDPFRHEALLYAGADDFVQRTGAFIQEGLDLDEPVLVVVARDKIDLLHTALGRDARRVAFADMAHIGHNPARIIPAWYDFVAERPTDGRRIRGIGEPIDPNRSPDALVECQKHESLLNLAFASSAEWWLLCPYDTTALDRSVIDEAMASHPWLHSDGASYQSEMYREYASASAPFDMPLPEPRVIPVEMTFGVLELENVRKLVWKLARNKGMAAQRTSDLVLAVNEIATNSLRHGGGRGCLRAWVDHGNVVLEVRDAGLIGEPLVGRRRPTPGQEGGFGVWLVHQLCDLVQIRTFADGSVVRVHMRIA